MVLDADLDAATGGGATRPTEIEGPTTAALRERLVTTDEFSVAIEFSTTSLDQDGPVRLLTISAGPEADEDNFHLGLEDMTQGADHCVAVTWGTDARGLGGCRQGNEHFVALGRFRASGPHLSHPRCWLTTTRQQDSEGRRAPIRSARTHRVARPLDEREFMREAGHCPPCG
jgi:hypothetical protein